MARKHPHIRDLLANRSGNTLVIAAAGMVPLFAMLGGAVDLTRTYLVKSRLQQACDAAVLAGRSSMGNQTWNSASKGVANGYFVSNYNPGRYGTSGSQISYDVGTDLVVHGAATVSVPMVLMQTFGFKNIDLATRCDAKLNTFTPAGMTYHDVGFLWGLRLLSGQGIFAAENQASSTGRLARHLIFMTDGQTETNIGDYDAYGVAALDRRRTPAGRLPTNDEQNALVERRLSGLCRMASTKGITVWVVAFGTQLTPLLRGCAAENHAFQANNAAELQNAFANIAGGIAQLRLVR